jgi:hypothetical protein
MRSRLPLARVGSLAAAVAVGGSLWARAASALELTWSAPPGCPSADLLQGEVARIVGRSWSEIESSWREVRAVVVERSGRFELTVELIGAGGKSSPRSVSSRSVSASSCTEAGEAVVAILTTSIAPPTRSEHAPEAASPEPSPLMPASSAPAPDRLLTEPESGAPVKPLLDVNLGVDFGSLPRAAPFAQVSAGVELGSLRALGFVGGTSSVLGQVEGTGAGAETSLLMGGALGCLAFGDGRLRPSACAGVELGRFAASGFGTPERRQDSALWSASLARAGLDYRIGDMSAVSLGVTAVVPFRHLRVVISPEEVHRAPTVAARPWLGLGVRFR